ncbi:poly(A) RNA polymerase GLD2 [Osmerus eperlanus]|uniref:poly(A) RNA polymerase GLD2 n=1 Tax=Osmerus eperlanus TaxID=29151 RepID=UPI002E141486
MNLEVPSVHRAVTPKRRNTTGSRPPPLQEHKLQESIRKHCHNLHSKTRPSDLARKQRIAERRAQHLKLPDPQQSLIKAQKVARRKQVKAQRRAIAKRKAKKRTKAQQAEAELQEVQLFQNIIKSDVFDMNRGFPSVPQNNSLRHENRRLRQRHAQLAQLCLQHNNTNPFNPPPVIPPYVWSPRPPYTPPGPPTADKANGRSRKRTNNDQGSFDLKRQRLSPPPQPSPGALSLSSPQTSSSLWGASPTLHPFSTDKLSGQILEVFEACGQKSSDLERKELCRTQLQKEIQRLFPLARLFLAGSSLNGFGSSSSDADLCMVLPRVSGEWNEAVRVLGQINKLFRHLSYLRNIQLIKAKVPILKARDTVSGVEFDLNINNTVGIRNTFLLRSYAYAEPRVRPIIMVVKKWAQHYGINDASKGTLSSYTLVLMVLHYLQTLKNPVVPSLQQQFPECFSVTMDIHMVPDGPRHIPAFSSTNTLSLGELLLGFLKYYTCSFRWDQKVISIREAKAIPRTSSSEWKNKFICVEEPFEQKNTARAVYEKSKFDAIKTCFTESWRALQQSKDLNSILPVRLVTMGR